MRILWLTIDRSTMLPQHFDILREVVGEDAEVVTLKKYPKLGKHYHMWHFVQGLVSGKVKVDNIILDYLKKDSDFDFIFCDAFFAYMNEDWDKINNPTGILIEDVHGGNTKCQLEKAKQARISTIFHRYNFGFHKLHPRAKVDFKCIWFPHSVSLKEFHKYKEKSVEVLHTGAASGKRSYPYRIEIIKRLKNKSYFTLINRPGYTGNRHDKYPKDGEYAKLLSSSKICITGGSSFNVPVRKYIEIPLNNALLMSNWFPDLGLLGFKDGENMVAYHLENVVEEVESLLRNDSKIKEISEKGMNLIRSRHTSDIRSKQFINNICNLIDKPLEFPEVASCSYQVNFNGDWSRVKIEEPSIKSIRIPKVINIKDVRKSKKSKKMGNILIGTDWQARIAQANAL